ncbi:group 1 truncated hemoglobin [bacterium]|nr:group 1 truncated hemoglobin [bacterium]
MESLYNRLGAEEGITTLVNDVVDLHFANPKIATRFEIAEDVEHSKRMLVEFFCAGSGGPQEYTGRDMLTTHKGMNISEEEYMSAIDDVFSAMDKNNIGEEEKKDVLSILYSLKGDIIRV